MNANQETMARWISIGLKCIFFGTFAGFVTYSGVQQWHQHNLEWEAEAWHTKAETVSKEGFRVADAADWLRKEGFVDVTTGERTSVRASGSAEEYLIATGFKEIDKGGALHGPMSVSLTFVFDKSQQFLKVEYHLWPFDMTREN
jgi:hypothetical protein